MNGIEQIKKEIETVREQNRRLNEQVLSLSKKVDDLGITILNNEVLKNDYEIKFGLLKRNNELLFEHSISDLNNRLRQESTEILKQVIDKQTSNLYKYVNTYFADEFKNNNRIITSNNASLTFLNSQLCSLFEALEHVKILTSMQVDIISSGGARNCLVCKHATPPDSNRVRMCNKRKEPINIDLIMNPCENYVDMYQRGLKCR